MEIFSNFHNANKIHTRLIERRFRPKNHRIGAERGVSIAFFGEHPADASARESRSIRDCELWASGGSSDRGSREGSVKGPARGWSGTTCGTAPWYLPRWYGGQQLAPDGQKLAGPAATARASPLFLLVARPFAPRELRVIYRERSFIPAYFPTCTLGEGAIAN